MKTKKLQSILFLLLALPAALNAQWNMVRWDQHNYFMKGHTFSASSFITTGVDQGWSSSFVMRTNDGGVTWDSLPFPAGSLYQLSSLEFTNLYLGYAGGLKDNNQVLLRTITNGNTWNDITPDVLSNYPINAISFLDPLNGYASDHAHIYKTNSAGTNWTPSNPGIDISDISFTTINDGFMCGSFNTDAVVMKTNDGGITWNNILTATTPFSGTIVMDNLDVISDNVVFSSLRYNNIIYRTLDGGTSWDTITVDSIYAIQDYDFIDAQTGHVLSIMGEIFGTNDGGQTWNLEYAVAGGFYGPLVYLNSISFEGISGYVCGSDGLIKKFTPSVQDINTVNAGSNISIHPNPLLSTEPLSIDGLSGECKIDIYSISGQIAFSKELNANESKHLLLENLHLKSGLYTISINNNGSKYTGKLAVID